MFVEKEFNSWDDLKQFLSGLDWEWVFRGQCNYSQTLKSSIDRAFDANAESKKYYEEFAIRRLKRNPDLYKDSYEVNDKIQAVSLLQHYGCATRLLDFSQSQYVAAFFSLTDLKFDGAIYAINYPSLNYTSCQLLYEKFGEQNKDLIQLLKNNGNNLSDPAFFNSLINLKSPPNFAFLIQPFYLFDRITRQSGCFLCQANINVSFEENLIENHNAKSPTFPPYYKLKVKKEWTNDIILDLERMNITNSTLFPGIEGFAKSLKRQFDIYNTRIIKD